MNSDAPVNVDLRYRQFPKPEKPVPPVEDDRLCSRCGELATAHYTALTQITQDPFGPITTRGVLLCPNSTYKAKPAVDAPRKREQKIK